MIAREFNHHSSIRAPLPTSTWRRPAPPYARPTNGETDYSGNRSLSGGLEPDGARRSRLSSRADSPSASLARFSHLVIAGVFHQISDRSCAGTAGGTSASMGWQRDVKRCLLPRPSPLTQSRSPALSDTLLAAFLWCCGAGGGVCIQLRRRPSWPRTLDGDACK